MAIDHQESVTPEFLAALPEVPASHPFNKDREKFLKERLKTKEEWEALGGNDPEDY